jgi:hypothetical protein
MYLPALAHQDWLTVSLARHPIACEPMPTYDGYLPRIVVRAWYTPIVLAALLLSLDRYLRQFGLMIAISIAAASVFFAICIHFRAV